MDMLKLASGCKKAAIFMSALESSIKNEALNKIIQVLKNNSDNIITANQKDLEKAKEENLDAPLLRRLKFDNEKILQACEGIETLIKLNDPVGETISATELDKGLELYKVSRPIGVIGVIFESRPDALVQIASLCLKSGNAVLLKGGSEAFHTNKILSDLILQAGIDAGLPKGWLGLLETRDDVGQMLNQEDNIDLIIPRGSNEFVKYIMDNTSIPVLGHADGICHVYVDENANIDMAVNLVVDSKCQYVAVCNAAETLLVHEKVSKEILLKIKNALESKGVKIYGCSKVCSALEVEKATKDDWKTEYLDLIISIKVVDSMDEAINHINHYGSGHTDVIVTKDKEKAFKFMDLVDTADAFWNCSSRFADGFRFGLGAEVGISTNKIHARGPVGMEGLMIYQWRMIGDGHIVADYSGDNGRAFTHRKIEKDFK